MVFSKPPKFLINAISDVFPPNIMNVKRTCFR